MKRRELMHLTEFTNAHYVSRLLALLLCISMLLGSVPASALNESDKNAIVYGTSGSANVSQDPSAAINPLSGTQVTSDNDPPQGSSGDINYSAVCVLSPDKPSFSTGESIRFTLNAQYATPGDEDKPRSVKFGIPIPDTIPEVQLPMFYATGSGEYAGVPMYPLNYSGTTIDLYLKTDSNGNRWIEFTLDAGSTVQGTLSMILPNGISDNVPVFTLTPEILSEGDYGTNTNLESGTTAVVAEFGWNDVKKVANTDNIGVIGAAAKDPDRISYSITADSKSSGLSTGRIFTERYILSDTIDLSGLNYADGTLTQSETNGISTFSVGGTPVLEIKAPLSSLSVTKHASDGLINSFSIEYTAYNPSFGDTTSPATELPNLDLSVTLLLAAMQLNPGTEETTVTNTAVFDAYSPFEDHHHSTATHTAYTQDRYDIEKTVYSDEACTIPVEQVFDDQYVWYKIIAKNNSAGTGPFTITDELPSGMIFKSAAPITPTQDGQTLTWSGVDIPSSETYTIIVKAQFDATKFEANPVHNTVVLRKGEQRLASVFVDVRYLSGIVDDSSIIYEKKVNRSSAGVHDTLRYTITARNEDARASSRLITIVDKWPGANVQPTSITGCSDYELLDSNKVAYTWEEVKNAATPIEIMYIKLYNVLVPKGGKATIYIDGVVTVPVTTLTNELIGVNGQNLTSAYSVGVGITKAAYRYDDEKGIGAMLTNIDAVVADQVVCYQMAVTNLTEMAIDDLTLTDKLPIGLTPVSGSIYGVTGQAIIKHGNNSYSPISIMPGVPSTYLPYTTAGFKLDAKEKVIIYLFARVSAQAVDASNASNNCITNAAYVNMPGGLVTGDATANIYTYVDTAQALYIKKSILFVADFDENLTKATTRLLSRDNDSLQWNKNDIVWNGAYVGYKIELINRSANGANTNPVSVYELIDTLPQGMEFVGVCINGNSDYYKVTNSAATALNDLGSQLIRDGETGTWSNDKYAAEEITCHYDKATNQVHITFNESSSGVLPVKYHNGSDATNLKPHFYLVARVKDDAQQTLYRNTVDAKVGSSVELNKLGDNKVSIRDGNGEDDGYKLISNYCDVNPIVFKPGISKKLVGHYFSKDDKTPETVTNEVNLFPGESLRFQLQVGTGIVSGSVGNRVHANLRDFTVTDILPAEYVYRPGSATITLNTQLDITTGAITEFTGHTKQLPRGSAEPKISILGDGRTKLTWDFSGIDKRLFVSTNNYSTKYFIHVITYDIDWNNNFAKAYGNYINQATVTHSQSFASVYSGMPDYGTNSISANTVVNVFGAAGTSAYKAVTNEANKTAFGSDTFPYVPVDGKGEKVAYTLHIENTTLSEQNSLTKSLVIIDELPRTIGDTGVVNRVNRGSQFSVLFGTDPDVSVYKRSGSVSDFVANTEYKVYYGISNGGLSASGDWSSSTAGSRIKWVKNSLGMNAIRIVFNSDFSLASGESLDVYFSALTGDDADPGEIAWNSFGYSYKSLTGGKLTERIYAEPPRVGIGVPGASITVEKSVSGDTAPSATPFSFVLKQNGVALADVKYTLSDDDAAYRTGPDGSFTITAAQAATLFVSPGNGYTIEELTLPDDFTLIGINPAGTGDGTYTAPPSSPSSVFTFRTLANGDSVGAICINEYSTPPTRDVSVSKKWTGQSNSNQPASIKVQLYKGGVADGEPVTLTAEDSWLYTWHDLSTAETWTVKEVDSLPGYTTTVTGDSIDGFVITNRYALTSVMTSSVQAEKVVTGEPNPPDETFLFRLMAVSYTAPTGSAETMTANQMPMPFGSKNGMKIVSITGEGNMDFGRLTFSKAGTYVYSISENAGASTLYAYDDSIYTLTYTVTDYGGRLSYSLEITKSDASTGLSAIVFTNTYAHPTGQLTVSKTVTNGGDVNALFTFHFTFSEDTRYAYVMSNAATGTIATGESLQLKHGESVTITIRQGVTYAVIEDAYEHYVPTPSDRTFTGTIGTTASMAEYTNLFDKPYTPPATTLTGNLTVQKTVTGDLGDRSKDFAFKIVFDAQGSYFYTGSKTGMIASGDTIMLRHGEYITIINLPAGTSYNVTESGNSNYNVYASGDTGVIAANRISTAAFTNNRSKVPLTGDDGSLLKGAILMLLSVFIGAALVVAERRLKRRRYKERPTI